MSRWRDCVLPSAGLSQPLLVDGHGISNKILCIGSINIGLAYSLAVSVLGVDFIAVNLPLDANC